MEHPVPVDERHLNLTAPADDPLAAYRDKIVYALAIAGVLGFLPFTVNNFLQGRIWQGLGTLSIVVILTVDAGFIYRKKPPPLPLWLMFVSIPPTMVLAVRA